MSLTNSILSDELEKNQKGPQRKVKTVARKKNINLFPEKTAIFLGIVYYPESTQNAGFYI
jgi:hypothetical protein